jgi:hypothetical protein
VKRKFIRPVPARWGLVQDLHGSHRAVFPDELTKQDGLSLLLPSPGESLAVSIDNESDQAL